MADGGFRGTTQDQDSRFADKQKKLMKSIKFPASYSTKVDIKKVNLDVIKPWITKKVVELLGIEDEVLINYIFAMLEENKTLDPKQLQINLTDFLAKQTPAFVTELWDLMISAQSNVAGIPQSFLDAKMAEVKKAEEDAARLRTQLTSRNSGVNSAGTVREQSNADESHASSRPRASNEYGLDRRQGASSSSSRWDRDSRPAGRESENLNRSNQDTERKYARPSGDDRTSNQNVYRPSESSDRGGNRNWDDRNDRDRTARGSRHTQDDQYIRNDRYDRDVRDGRNDRERDRRDYRDRYDDRDDDRRSSDRSRNHRSSGQADEDRVRSHGYGDDRDKRRDSHDAEGEKDGFGRDRDRRRDISSSIQTEPHREKRRIEVDEGKRMRDDRHGDAGDDGVGSNESDLDNPRKSSKKSHKKHKHKKSKSSRHRSRSDDERIAMPEHPAEKRVEGDGVLAVV